MLGGLHRNGRNGEQEFEIICDEEEEAKGRGENEESGRQQEEDKEQQNSGEKNKKKRYLKFNDSQGLKTLEKPDNINLSAFEADIFIDPLFKQTTQKFDEMDRALWLETVWASHLISCCS